MTTGTTPTAAALKGTSTVRARCGGALATLALVLGVLTGVVPGSSAGATGPPPLTGITQITSGAMHSCALLNSGSVRCWGDNGFGQLGNGTTRDASVPLAVAGITNAVAIDSASTSLSTCAVLATGGVRCWGRNHHGQLGNGTTTDSTTPVAVSNITGATSIAAGQDHTCVALSNGEARCWGWNNRGQLGNGTTTDTLVPATVTGLTGAAAVSAGGGHTCAALTDQSVRCWGSNAWGALGNGSSATDSKVPVMVSGISTATAISSGFAHTCATLTSGGVRCWGQNIDGQLGDGTTTDSTTPVAVSNITNATSVSGGYQHSCVRLADGGASCWGYNYAGLLGDGTTTDSTTPVTVSSLGSATKMAAGQSQSCALLSTGQGRCWGYNGSGQLGNGTIAASPLPTVVVGVCEAAPDPGFIDVSTGANYYNAVAWLVRAGITGGTAPGKYSPNAKVTRAQMAVFLWTNAAKPTPTAPHTFTDVPTNSYYSTAVSWLIEAGITGGTAPGKYSPNAKVTRAQMAAFLKANTCGPTTA